MLNQEELERFNKSRSVIKTLADSFETRARGPNKRDNDEYYSESLNFFYKESESLIPNKTVFKDGGYYCPTCKCKISAIYSAASEAEIPVSFCPCCGQAFNGLIGFDDEDDDEADEETDEEID